MRQSCREAEKDVLENFPAVKLRRARDELESPMRRGTVVGDGGAFCVDSAGQQHFNQELASLVLFVL